MAYRPISSVSVSYGATSVSVPGAVPFGCRRVRLEWTSGCYVSIGQPTSAATTSSVRLQNAYGPEVFAVVEGDTIQVIQATAGGTLNVTFLEEFR